MNKLGILGTSFKIIGTVSIGYVAGSYLCLSKFILPAMKEHCPLSSIQLLLEVVNKHWIRYILPLESFAATLILSSYILSEPHVSHPYLLYSGFGVASLIPISFFYIRPKVAKIIQDIRTKDISTLGKRNLESCRRSYLANTVLSSIIFFMTVIGSYGDTLSI
ncbi:hypothetical protein T552_03491 [Pneumocystis carinii B80]|uniref:DUF4149 domain-containing protein n=1 Tax=Pneumocystis carinii (strain B80) TaxID=1408658 RepID=A0A0W4ZB40_PNEC8|nr:hypothetical protein T552_03491 [Pneumocystis carinii B80]KTW25631.1 hypothetical protein T552_03491 [Pneumocystis carinii B80]